jgi:hypothetical protein
MKMTIEKLTPLLGEKKFLFVDINFNDMGMIIKGMVVKIKEDSISFHFPHLKTHQGKVYTPVVFQDEQKKREIFDFLKNQVQTAFPSCKMEDEPFKIRWTWAGYKLCNSKNKKT